MRLAAGAAAGAATTKCRGAQGQGAAVACGRRRSPDFTVSPAFMLIFRDGSLDGAEAMRFLISVAMHMKASSTLLAFLADVSRKGMLTDCCAEVKGRVGGGPWSSLH